MKYLAECRVAYIAVYASELCVVPDVEDIAAEYLKTNPSLKEKLEQKRSTDSAFAKNGGAQLNFVYQNSSYFEPVNMRYFVYWVMSK